MLVWPGLCLLCDVIPVKKVAVSYSVALGDLKVLCKKLALPSLTLHSDRNGAATGTAMSFCKLVENL